MDENVLMHHGVKGQKWGVRRYQNADGSLTSAGKKHRNADGGSTAGKIGAKVKSAATATVKGTVKTAKFVKKKLDEHEKAKIKKIASSGNAEQVYKYRKKMSDTDLRNAINRIKLDQDIKNIQRNEKFKAAEHLVNDLATAAGLATKTYNSVDSVAGIFRKIAKNNEEKADKAERKEIEKVVRSGDKQKIFDSKEKMNFKEWKEAQSRANDYTKFFADMPLKGTVEGGSQKYKTSKFQDFMENTAKDKWNDFWGKRDKKRQTRNSNRSNIYDQPLGLT